MDIPIVEEKVPNFVEAERFLEPVVHPEVSSPVIQFASSNVKGNKLKLGSKWRRKLLAADSVPAVSPLKQDAWSGDFEMDVQDMNSRFMNAKLQSSEKKQGTF